VFGATFDRTFESISLTDEATARNNKQLKHYLPEWQASLPQATNGHAAIRTTTPDRFPYVGGIPSYKFYQQSYESLKHGRVKENFPDAEYQQGLFVLGGLGARGLTTSGYCAQLLGDLINNKKQDALLSTMHPARFLIRQLRRGKPII
jgi:tRNA 5-methylaminomethyl-2-thiouridine biosynthesis bifunctional protein